MRVVREISVRMPIRWRLALVSFGLLAVLLSAVGVLISVTEEQALLTNQAIALRDEARLATAGTKGRILTLAPPSLRPPSIGDLPSNLGDRAVSLARQLAGANIRATIIAPDGTVLASSNDLPLVPPAVTVDSATIRQAFTATPTDTSYVVASDSEGQHQLVVLLPLVNGQHTVALLQLNTPTAPIDRSLTTMRLILTIGIASALGIAAALTLPLVAAALRPLVMMERTSRRIADGELSLRLDVPPTHDEIGRLARSFNRMVARLEEAFLRQKHFVADVSHELRTPLTALGGSLEMLLLGADKGDAEAARRLARGMYAEVERMRRLVEDLLALTRIDEGRTALREEVIEVKELLSKVCEQAQRLSQGQEIHCEVGNGSFTIRADADRLHQVLLNLVENALKFTPPPGKIELTARDENNDAVIIEVHDTGVGIPPEALPHVFDRFYRADSARTRTPQQRGGNGLGLAIARELVEAHSGTITISSDVGIGTTVTIRLPSDGTVLY
ncbi:MAG: HAMP domain-containing histidine kinase [Chloroflexota bacterium]|nr:HAMP domain-containing histidine kinase [Chloroflexota bacterium]